MVPEHSGSRVAATSPLGSNLQPTQDQLLEKRLLDVEPVFSLVEDRRSRPIQNRIGDLLPAVSR